MVLAAGTGAGAGSVVVVVVADGVVVFINSIWKAVAKMARD